MAKHQSVTIDSMSMMILWFGVAVIVYAIVKIL